MFFFFFFQAEDGIRDVAVTGVQTCALPILEHRDGEGRAQLLFDIEAVRGADVLEIDAADGGLEQLAETDHVIGVRSEEHTSELQSRLHLVCRLLLEKKKTDPWTLSR